MTPPEASTLTPTPASEPGEADDPNRRSSVAPLSADVDGADVGASEHLADRSVSVIIATRDRPQLLRRALAGVLAQRHDAPVEIVLVFDRSEPDHSLAELATDKGHRVDVVITTNQRTPGLAGARNSGIDISSGAWIAFCDDDDEWLPGKLQAQFETLAASPGCRAACTGILIRYNGTDTARMPNPDRVTFDGFLRDRMTEVHPSSWLVHRQTLVDRIGLVDEEIPGSYAEDYDLFLRTARKTGIAVATQPLVRVWWHGASFFFERWKMIDEALGYLTEKYPEFGRHPDGLARIRGQQAVAQAAMGDRTRALRTIAATARLHPTEKRLPLALAVAAGLKAESALKLAHRFGKGI
ncbi:MAG: glycosyltransferase family 2 protein [Acidimicrobiia bacterium]|nr:glycosyltransferase family 2 protein [Acidimicrobiia bacterium]